MIVTAWIDAYEKAWRTAGTGALTRLFTEDAVYRPRPFEPPGAGLEAVAEFWEAETSGAPGTHASTQPSRAGGPGRSCR